MKERVRGAGGWILDAGYWFQVSASPLAKKPAILIEKETLKNRITNCIIENKEDKAQSKSDPVLFFGFEP